MFAANGSFTYRPNPDATGSDSFSVGVADSPASGVIGTVTIQITAVNDPPAPHDDMLPVTPAGVADVNVLANDVEVDGDALTVTIESAAEVGTAAVNPNKTIAISGLPAGFRGVTRFKYRVTDPSGLFSVATAVVFVDVDPFRVVFAADEPGQDSPELFITNIASAPVLLSGATEGTLRLRSFVGSTNGSTVAYRRHDQAQGNAPVGLSFVRTADPATQVRIQLPAGMVLQPTGGLDFDTYVVSPDGQWIAGMAAKQPSGTFAVFLLNVANPAVILTASPPDMTFVRDVRFSDDSQHVYFVAVVPSNGSGNYSLYRTAVETPDQPTPLSETPSGNLTDQVVSYWVSPDQSKLVLYARREDSINLFYVSMADPRNEIRIHDELEPNDEIVSSVVQFGTPGGTARVAYSVSAESVPILKNFVAEVSATPNRRALAPDGFLVEGMRPDGQAVALSGPPGMGLVEQVVDSGLPPALIGDGLEYFNVRYDARGDAIFSQVTNPLPTPGDFYLSIGTAVRPAFGTIQHAGTPGTAALITNFTGVDRAIAIIGERPPVQPTPPVRSAPIAIVNAWAPDKLLYLSDLLTPQVLRSGRAQVVSP